MGYSLRERILDTYTDQDQHVIWDLIEMLMRETPADVAAFLADPYKED